MNAYLSASTIKREPEDNEDAEQITQSSKRRKVDDERVVVKSEPMDTDSATQPNVQPTIKDEPPDYDDSDANTEADSDEEMDTGMDNGNKMPSHQNPPEDFNTNGVKREVNSDNEDTDEASDDEDENIIPNAVNARNNDPPQGKRLNKQVNNEPKTGASRNRTENHSVEQRIKTEPVTTHDSTAMVVSEPTEFELNVKTEPVDEVKSDEETDEENNAGDVDMEQDDERPQTIKKEVEDVRYDQYNKNQRNFKNFDEQLRRQQPSTSNSFYDSYPSASNTPNLPVAPSAEMYSTRPANIKKQPLNIVGTRSSKPVQAADGAKVLRFNHFEPAVNDDMNEQEVYDIDDYEGIDMTDDLIMYVKDFEKQLVDELAELKRTMEMEKDNFSKEQWKEYAKKCERLTRKKEGIVKQKTIEEAKKTNEERERKRDDFMRKLFRPDFDVSALDQRLGVNTQSAQRMQPSPSLGPSNSSASDQKDRKLLISYNEFMNKVIKLENPNPMKEHHYNMAVNDYVHKMEESDMIDLVPKKVIDTVRGDKENINKKVEKFLKPYLERNVISDTEYSTICKTVKKHQYETNDYGENFIC